MAADLPKELLTFGRGKDVYRVVAITDDEADAADGPMMLRKHVRLVIEKRGEDWLGKDCWFEKRVFHDKADTGELKRMIDALIFTMVGERGKFA